MQIVEIIKKKTGLTTYKMAQILERNFNVIVSRKMLDKYIDCHSMRLDVLSSLRKISGLTWNQIGKIIDREYGSD